jgi:hypothetical protein
MVQQRFHIRPASYHAEKTLVKQMLQHTPWRGGDGLADPFSGAEEFCVFALYQGTTSIVPGNAKRLFPGKS